MVAPAAKAAADAACPLGKDDVQGMRWIRRANMVRSGSGRRRPIIGLITVLETKLAALSEATPRSPARRLRLPASTPTAAMPIHSSPWLADLVSSRRALSTGSATGVTAGMIIGSGISSVARIAATIRPESRRSQVVRPLFLGGRWQFGQKKDERFMNASRRI